MHGLFAKCIDTKLFNDFFNKDKDFVDFLKYVNRKIFNIFKKENGRIVVYSKIDILDIAGIDVDVICDGMIFKKIVRFQNCNFKGKVSFKNCIFEEGVYFNNSIFSNHADFHECKFYKDACFYGVTFEKVPNFSACYFKELKAVNLINVNIDDLDFNKVENFIENNFNDEQCNTEIKWDLTNQPVIEQKYKLKYAKNIKDSFRTIKDILITQNNTLEAQEWHKLELYAKEIEIETNLEKTHKSDRKQPLNQPKETNLIGLTIDKIILWLYRNTSFHHTNFTRILNFSSCVIAVYALIMYIFYLSMPYSDLFITKAIVLFVAIGCISYNIKKSGVAFINILIAFLILFGSIVLALSLCMPRIYANILFFITLYILSIVAVVPFYFTNIIQKSFISFLFHYVIYFLILIVLVIKPQIINPFVGIFPSNKLFENELEAKLNTLNPNIIIKLSKISQKEFIEQIDYQTINNVSFVEANEAKKVIVANRAELNDIISFVFNNKKIEYFKQILLTLENSPSDLVEIIKNIDDSNNNFAVLYDMTKLLNLDFTNNNNDINYNLNKKMSYLFIMHSNEAYEIFNSKENQTKLKNILSLINLDKSLHLQEIKQTIDYDIIMSSTIKSTSIIYSIILLLCIFSLQKTARKNSIIPS